MSYILQTKEELDEIIYNLFKSAGFDNTGNSGTPEHALYKLLTEELYRMYSTLDSAYKGALPLDAAGTKLDLWGNFFGSPRTLASYAKDDTLTNVYFYFPDNYDISSTADVTIATGTSISSNGVSKFYKTTAQGFIETTAGERVAYVPVLAEDNGDNNNINSGELNFHELNIEGLEVNNKFPITTGTFNQTDADLRVSIQDIFGKTIGTNLSSIQKDILDLAGVANVEVFPLKRGTGTYSVFIDSVAPIVSLQLINEVQSVLNNNQALGINGYVEYPDYKALTLKFEVLPKDGIDEDELLTELASTEATNIVNYINNIPRGSSFRPNDVLRFVLDNTKINSGSIKNMKIGSYSIIDQTITDNEGVSPTPKHIDIDEKWFTSTDLITFCTVTFE